VSLSAAELNARYRVPGENAEFLAQAFFAERIRLVKRRDAIGPNCCEGQNITITLRAFARVLAGMTKLQYPKPDKTKCGYCDHKLTPNTGEGPDPAIEGGWRCKDGCACSRRQGSRPARSRGAGPCPEEKR